MVTRRAFLKYTGATTLTLFGYGTVSGVRSALAAVAGGTLDIARLPKFVTPLVVPPSMPATGVLKLAGGGRADYYEIAVRQFRQPILPAGCAATTVWGYGSVHHPETFHYPSFTIEATWRVPVRVKWINQLVDAGGNHLPHLLPVDPTLHWANPPGGKTGRDTRPTFSATPEPYTGPVPIVTHVHGAIGVGDESDGYAEAWYLPALTPSKLPAGYATEGTWYDFFRNKAFQGLGVAWEPGSATCQYPNDWRASTSWYHDHTLGITRLNVYAGPAGFWILRGGPDGDAAVLDTRSGKPAVLPGPAPRFGEPANQPWHEIPLVIQDRSFNRDGSLFYPDRRTLAASIEPRYIPHTDIAPIWNPEFFGNVMVVNGKAWPFLDVERRRYRFRLLNGCDGRFLVLKFDHPAVQVWQIGNEVGFLSAPVRLKDVPPDGVSDGTAKLLIAPAERADVIVDFTEVPTGTSITLRNVGPDEPFGGFPVQPADPESTGQVMQFRVGAARDSDPTTPPQFLTLPPITPLVGGTARPLALLEEMSTHPSFAHVPVETLLGTVEHGVAVKRMWMDPVTENPAVGATEVWEFYNFTVDAHPMHVHEVAFQLVNRERLVLDPSTGEPMQPVQLTGVVRPPEPWEMGFKDTVIAYPGEVTRIRAQFRTSGQFVWHCHIVGHEDNEMMRPFRIGPPQPGQPT
jgi:FtsP/CotA-like multicopper oxidase with cupredoxin domain